MSADVHHPVRRRPGESGAVLVEFSLSVLPLLGFLFLTMCLAWVVFAWGAVQEAVREGTRLAITCVPTTNLNAAIQSEVIKYSYGFVGTGNAGSVLNITYLDSVTLQPKTGLVYTGDVVRVSVSNLQVYTFAPIMRPNSPIYVGAVASDVMSCPTPASP